MSKQLFTMNQNTSHTRFEVDESALNKSTERKKKKKKGHNKLQVIILDHKDKEIGTC